MMTKVTSENGSILIEEGWSVRGMNKEEIEAVGRAARARRDLSAIGSSTRLVN